MRATLAAAVVLLGTPAPASGQEVYKWTSETRSFSYVKQVCDRDPYTVTEIVTQEIFNRGSGVSHVGNGRDLPRGSSVSSGRIRRAYSKVVQGPDPAPPEDYTVTQSLPLLPANWGAVNRAGKQRSIDVTGPDDPVTFGRLKKGKSITIRIDRTAPPLNEDDGRCVNQSTGSTTGFVTITRVK